MSNKDAFLQTLDRYGRALLQDPTGDEVIRLRAMLVAQAGFSPKATREPRNSMVDERTPNSKESGPL